MADSCHALQILWPSGIAGCSKEAASQSKMSNDSAAVEDERPLQDASGHCGVAEVTSASQAPFDRVGAGCVNLPIPAPRSQWR